MANHAPRPGGAVPIGRRRFLAHLAGWSAAAVAGDALLAPLAGAGPAARAGGSTGRFAFVRADRPTFTSGIQSGDVNGSSAVLWARADRPAQIHFSWSTTEQFTDVHSLPPVLASPETDLTAKLWVRDLPLDQRIFYRVQLADVHDPSLTSPLEIGSFPTPSTGRRDVSFVFTGDTAGQGWGINPEWGGMRCFETMRAQQPDFFINSGDTIYADGIIKPEVTLPDGTIWKNIVTPEKAKVAETLDEFRGNFRYNLLDDNLRRLNAEVPVVTQWDDHETVNNWYPGEIIDYRANDYRNERNVDVLAARARQAFFEYYPIRPGADEDGRVYRRISYGPLLDVFVVDMRTYRAANSENRQPAQGPETAFLGARQLAWLKEELASSTATWKAIAADMPIGLVVADYADGANPHYPGGNGPGWYEGVANRDGGAPSGRELEVADLLSFLKARRVRNVVWFTADVHYAAAHHYDPARAAFTDFDPFWEFVAGPVNAGSFGPNELDATFGPEVRFVKAPPAGQANLPPSAGLQFFGRTRICHDSRVMTVALMDVAGDVLYEVELEPA